MNNEELLKEFDRRQKELQDEFIAKLEDDKKEFELTYPRDDDDIYFISNVDAEICFARFHSSNETDRCAFEHGLYFKTEEEAEQHLKESELLFRIKKWAEIHNEGWKPDLTNHRQEKWSIVYNIRVDGFIPHNMRVFSYLTHDLPYFKSRKVAQDFIKEFGKEIHEVLL